MSRHPSRRSPDHSSFAGAPRGAWIAGLVLLAFFGLAAGAQEAEEYEPIGSDSCADCHEESDHDTIIAEDLSHSIHEGMECLDCHSDKDTMPHQEGSDFVVGCEGCRTCHDVAAEEYQSHGRAEAESCEDIPKCSSCHGDHDVLPSNVKASKTHRVNLPQTCGKCHEDLDLTSKYEVLIDHPIEIYETSVHGQTTQGGLYVSATCNDCHASEGSAHKILSPGDPKSPINHFNIPSTCGQCHKSVQANYDEGIHGKLVARGETDSPVCTHCHGEHGIVRPDDPASPVSGARVAQETCAPCHESAVLNAKYGVTADRIPSFIDSYHGLKSKSGDTHVANCASCHGVHRILPSSDASSMIHPSNLQATCGRCHPGISEKLASQPIHGVSGEKKQNGFADLIEQAYIIAIFVIIGGMLLHWTIDYIGHVRIMMASRPQIRRMSTNEVWQHTMLMLTFVVLVISGFALRFAQSWLTRLFFGWEGGFEVRGQVHRFAAVAFMVTVVWHVVYAAGHTRGRNFIKDMFPTWRDAAQVWRRMMHAVGRRKNAPRFARFSYAEKAEYWALVWGSAIMIVTGLMLWFDNWFINLLPDGFLDVALVFHYYEAWLATLAILVWHLYGTVFSPHVYPMNPSWLTGRMPEEMYRHEHPRDIDEARKETEAMLRAELEKMQQRDSEESEG
jgi:cytochrome b subunit of formate dehydrogenase